MLLVYTLDVAFQALKMAAILQNFQIFRLQVSTFVYQSAFFQNIFQRLYNVHLGYTETPPDTTFLITSGGVYKLIYLLPILNGPFGDDGVSSSSGASEYSLPIIANK